MSYIFIVWTDKDTCEKWCKKNLTKYTCNVYYGHSITVSAASSYENEQCLLMVGDEEDKVKVITLLPFLNELSKTLKKNND